MNLDVLLIDKNILNHSYPFFSRKESRFFGILKDGDDEAVENFESSFDDIHVAVCNRIEGSRIDGNSFLKRIRVVHFYPFPRVLLVLCERRKIFTGFSQG
jgi:hypothetical protein